MTALHSLLPTFVFICLALVLQVHAAYLGSQNARVKVRDDGLGLTTNAQRFALGLPPLPPRNLGRRGSPIRRDADPPAPSPSSFTGFIAVTSQSGDYYGLLSTERNRGGSQGYTTDDQTIALNIKFTYTPGQTFPFSIRALNTDNFPYLGGTASKTSPNLISGSNSVAYISYIDFSAAGSYISPANSGCVEFMANDLTESSIWLLSNTVINGVPMRELKPQWHNPTWSETPVYLIWDHNKSAFAVSGDPTKVSGSEIVSPVPE
ncbi:hypothetical protein FRB99_003032 [Tulasnella sp. 403]|nr:hypothetical protein FRB99_003032 [Tulasnella sp. 403]